MTPLTATHATPTLQATRFIQALGSDVTLKIKNGDVGGSVELFRHSEPEPITAQRITKNTEVCLLLRRQFGDLNLENLSRLWCSTAAISSKPDPTFSRSKTEAVSFR